MDWRSGAGCELASFLLGHGDELRSNAAGPGSSWPRTPGKCFTPAGGQRGDGGEHDQFGQWRKHCDRTGWPHRSVTSVPRSSGP